MGNHAELEAHFCLRLRGGGIAGGPARIRADHDPATPADLGDVTTVFVDMGMYFPLAMRLASVRDKDLAGAIVAIAQEIKAGLESR